MKKKSSRKWIWIVVIVAVIICGFFCVIFSYCSSFGCNYCGIIYIRSDFPLGRPKFLIDPKYCETHSDCVMDKNNCDAFNKYHYERNIEEIWCAWEVQPIPCCKDNMCTLCGGEPLPIR